MLSLNLFRQLFTEKNNVVTSYSLSTNELKTNEFGKVFSKVALSVSKETIMFYSLIVCHCDLVLLWFSLRAAPKENKFTQVGFKTLSI